MLEFQKGIVVEIINETENTRRFIIEARDMAVFDFIPGQFVTLDLPIHEKKNKRMRSYSIASAPNKTNVFELLIVKVEDGEGGSKYIFENWIVGTEISFRGALGQFILPKEILHPIIFVCTGTGIAPFRSMLQHIKNHNISHKKIFLLFGTRFQSDILYHLEMKNLESQLNDFYFVPVLSREKWDGKIGYVHEVYKEIITTLEKPNFYLCGWRNMVDEARNNLKELGLEKEQIHFELYG